MATTQTKPNGDDRVKPIKPVPSFDDQIDTLTAEIEKLTTRRDELNSQRLRMFDEVKAAGDAMKAAQQQAVISGNGVGYTEARQQFDKLAMQDVELHQELNTMDEGIQERKAAITQLRNKQRHAFRVQADRWMATHGAKVEQEFAQALARYLTLKGMQVGADPNPQSVVGMFIRDNTAWAATYARIRAEISKEMQA